MERGLEYLPLTGMGKSRSYAQKQEKTMTDDFEVHPIGTADRLAAKDINKMSERELRHELRVSRELADQVRKTDTYRRPRGEFIALAAGEGYDPYNSYDDHNFWRRFCRRHLTAAQPIYEVAP